MKKRRHHNTVTLAGAALLAAIALSGSPRAAGAQACVAGSVLYYQALAAGNQQCSIGSVALTWNRFDAFDSFFDPGIQVSPISGSNAYGSYFGFRMTRPAGGPMLSASWYNWDDNISFDPTHLPAGGVLPGYLWGFDHSLSTPGAITRVETRMVNFLAKTVSQQPIAPTFVPVYDTTDPSNPILLGNNPDVSSGCGWRGVAGYNGVTYDAANVCGFYVASAGGSVNEGLGLTDDGLVWSHAQSLGDPLTPSPDVTEWSCWQGTSYVAFAGPTCSSFLDLNGQDLGTSISGSVSTYAGAMFDPSITGVIDPNDPALGAQSSIDSYEFALYYQANVTATPEPSSLALSATGLLGLGGLLRKRNRRTVR